MSVPTICSVGYIPTAPVRAAVLHPSGKYLLSTCLNILSVHPLFSADAFHLSICSSPIHCIVTLSDTPHIVTVHDTCMILWHLALKKPLSVVAIEAATGHPPQRDAVAIAESSSSDRYSIAVVSNGLGCITVSVYSCSLVSGFVAKPYDELVIPDFSSIVSICAFPFSRTLLCCSAKEIIFVGVRSLVSFKPAAGTTLELLSRISNSVLLNSSDEFVAACTINSEGLVAVLTKCVRVVFFDTSASIIRVISVSSAENLHPRFSSMAACSQYLYIGTLCGRVHICRTDCNYACASIIENPFASQNAGLLAASASVCRILPRIFPSSLMLVTYGNGISVFLDTAHDFLLKMRMLSATGRKMVLFHNSPFPLSALYESFRLFDPSTMTLFECKYGTSTDMKLLCHSMFPTDASITAFCQHSPTDRWHINHIVSYWGDDMGRVHLLKLKPTASACQEIQHRQCIIVPNIEHRHGVSDLILCPQERYLVVVWKSGRACIYDTQSAFAPCCSFNVCVSSSQDSVHFRSVWFLSANRLIVRSSSTGIIVYRLIPVLSPALPAYRVGAVDTGSYASAELGFRVLTEGAFDCVMDAFSTRWSEEAGLTDGIFVSGLVCHPFLPYVWLSLTSGLCVLLDVGSDTCVRGYFPIAIGARLVTIDHSGLYLAFADSHAAHEGGRIIFYQSLTGSFLPFATISNSAGFMANMSVSADGKALCGVGSFGEIVTWRMHASVPQTIANLYLTVGRDAPAGESVKDQLRRWWLLHPISYQKSGESETIHTEQSFALSVDRAIDRSCSATRGYRPSRSATLPADLLPYPVMDSLDSSSVASVSRPRFLSDSFSSTVSAGVGSPSRSLPPRMAGTPATPVGRRDASTDCGLLQRFEGNTTVSHEENLQVTSKPVRPSPLFATMSPAEEEVCEDIVNSFLSNCVFVDKQPRLPSNVDDAMNSEHAMASEPVPSLATVSGDDSGTSIEGTGAIVASASAGCMEIIDDIVATVGQAIEVPFVGTTGEDSPNAIPSVLTAGPVAPEFSGKSSALLSSPRDEALSVDAKEQENLQNSEEDENQGAVCLSEQVETTGTETVSQEHSETIPDADMQQ